MFNGFFTSITSSSELSSDEAKIFMEQELNINPFIVKPDFKFSFTTTSEIDELISTIPSSSAPGINGIQTKIFKSSSKVFKTGIAYLFNYSILTNSIPNEWKTAVVTPFFKNKGSNGDINNYRGISILPPIAKIFEKLLHKQILGFLYRNNID
ncbi:unnamed protein product [Brachionus calyciflorus]|uniref:Reverse transcriptase domain-containing protein n=1 Tax=Brachionus calyciflorus TaxID=104777 RepID=A0A813U2G5_9BILA|nr:unnamed protein product [Brachionus calyciflorus]